MPRYTIDTHTLTHTCPASPEPHVVETWRAIVAVDAWGPCISPRTIRCGTRTVQVACAGISLPDDECGPCRSIVVVRNATTVDIGPELACPSTGASGVLPQPCPSCGLPVSAVFAATGRHLLCGNGSGR